MSEETYCELALGSIFSSITTGRILKYVLILFAILYVFEYNKPFNYTCLQLHFVSIVFI